MPCRTRCGDVPYPYPRTLQKANRETSKNEFIQFIGYAQGSRGELQTQLLLAKDFGYLTEEEIEPVFYELEEIGKMLHVLAKSL